MRSKRRAHHWQGLSSKLATRIDDKHLHSAFECRHDDVGVRDDSANRARRCAEGDGLTCVKVCMEAVSTR